MVYPCFLNVVYSFPIMSDGNKKTRQESRDDGGPSMSLFEHLDELRTRLMYCVGGVLVAMIGTFATARWWILPLLTQPYKQAMEEIGEDPGQGLVTIAPTEAFVMYTKVALIAGLIFTSPWISYHLWKFVGVGLYRKERKIIKVAVPFSAGLFITGSLFYLFVVSKPMIYFLLYFAKEWAGAIPMMTIQKSIGLVVSMMLVFGLGFQLPVVVAILGRIGLVTTRTLSHYRRYVIVCLFIFAALVTSPSPVDQILLALPMWVLFELGVLLVYLGEKKQARIDAEGEAESEQDGPDGDPDVTPTDESDDDSAPPDDTPDEDADDSDADDQPHVSHPDFEDPYPDTDDYYDYQYMQDYDQERQREEYGLWGQGNGVDWTQRKDGLWGSSDQWVNPLDNEEKE